MDVISSTNLWRDYDRRALPLGVTVLSEKTGTDKVETRLYFSGDSTPDGVSRVYARYARPLGDGVKPVVVLLPDAGVCVDDVDVSPFVNSGFGVFVPDYCGKNDKGRFTIYPASQSDADLGGEGIKVDALRYSRWYIWTVVALRSVTYLESLSVPLSDIAVIGVGIGSAQAFKCAALESLAAAVCVYPSGQVFTEDFSEEEYLAFRTGLASASYAKLLKTETLLVVCSNDFEGRLDKTSELYNMTNEKCRECIVERARKSLGSAHSQSILRFLNLRLVEKSPDALPAPPEIKLSASDGALYAEASSGSGSAVTQLYAAYSEKNGAFRNWHALKTETVGEGKYLARIPVYDPHEPVYAFASVAFEDGLRLSSEVVKRTPDDLGVKGNEFKKNRLVYDSDMGVDDFTSVAGGGNECITLVEGPFGLMGLTCVTHDIATYKVGDVNFKGETDSVLQLMLHVRVGQELCFKVTDKDYAEYQCVKSFSPFDDWTKVVFRAGEFKGEKGALFGWDSVICLEISGSEEFLINSVLWA